MNVLRFTSRAAEKRQMSYFCSFGLFSSTASGGGGGIIRTGSTDRENTVRGTGASLVVHLSSIKMLSSSAGLADAVKHVTSNTLCSIYM